MKFYPQTKRGKQQNATVITLTKRTATLDLKCSTILHLLPLLDTNLNN